MDLYESAREGGASRTSAVIALCNTRFSNGYDERAFETISAEDTMEHVIATLGQPLSRIVMADSNPPMTIWSYSTSMWQSNQYYFDREIVFADGGSVKFRWSKVGTIYLTFALGN